MNASKGAFSGRLFFLVEDEEDVLAIIKYMLEREGAEVSVARDGREAEARIGAPPVPDVVVLDIMLPFTDGYSLLKKIRENRSWKDARVMMLTAKDGGRDVVRGFDAGADDYLSKPFDSQELLARLRRLLPRS